MAGLDNTGLCRFQPAVSVSIKLWITIGFVKKKYVVDVYIYINWYTQLLMGTTKFSNKVGPSIVLWELTNKTGH